MNVVQCCGVIVAYRIHDNATRDLIAGWLPALLLSLFLQDVWFGRTLVSTARGQQANLQMVPTNQSDKSVRQNWVQDRFDCKKQGILNKVGGVVATKTAARADGPENNFVARLPKFCRLGAGIFVVGGLRILSPVL